jgi:hypothetical protein
MSDTVLRLADHRPKPENEPPAWEYLPCALIVVHGIAWEEWVSLWNTVEQLDKSSKWYVGDALLAGQREFNERFSQVVDAQYIHQQRGALWVSSRIPPAERREGLSWSVHREAASLSPARRKKMLDLAEANGWGSKEVIEEINRRYPDARQKHAPRKQSEMFQVEQSELDAGSTDKPRHVHVLDEVSDRDPMTLDEAVDLLTNLPVGALPDNITEAIALVLDERAKLLRVLAVARETVLQYHLPDLAAAVEALETPHIVT